MFVVKNYLQYVTRTFLSGMNCFKIIMAENDRRFDTLYWCNRVDEIFKMQTCIKFIRFIMT